MFLRYIALPLSIWTTALDAYTCSIASCKPKAAIRPNRWQENSFQCKSFLDKEQYF